MKLKGFCRKCAGLLVGERHGGNDGDDGENNVPPPTGTSGAPQERYPVPTAPNGDNSRELLRVSASPVLRTSDRSLPANASRQPNLSALVRRGRELKEAKSLARIIFLLDATGSMEPWIAAVKSHIREILRRVYQVTGIEKIFIQFAAYRDYFNGKGLLLEPAEMSNNAEKMEHWLGRLECIANDSWNEAVEYALQFALHQKDVDAVFLIGDAVGHTRSELIQMGRAEQPDALTLSRLFGERGIPLYCLVAGDNGETLQHFRDMAGRSAGGQSGRIDEEAVRDMVAAAIINLLKGLQGIKDYEAAYPLSNPRAIEFVTGLKQIAYNPQSAERSRHATA